MLLMVMMLTDVDGIRHRRHGDSVVTTSSRMLLGNQPQQQTHYLVNATLCRAAACCAHYLWVRIGSRSDFSDAWCSTL